MRHIVYIFFVLTFFACNSKTENLKLKRHQVPFQESGLRVTCTRAIKTLDNEIHGIHYIDNLGKPISKDSINNLLYSISELDNFTQENANKYITKEDEIFEKTDINDKLYKLVTTSYLMKNPGNLTIDEPIKTQIALQDYDLFLNDRQKHITLRFLNDYDIIKININSLEINKLSESIPIGLEKVISKLDSLKDKKNASR
jgi:arsenate reductase-like glutaredoxin family protein